MDSTTQQDAFAIKVSNDGQVLWSWQSQLDGDDAANAVVELPNGQLVVAGWRTVNVDDSGSSVAAIGRRTLFMLSLQKGEQISVSDPTSFGDGVESVSNLHSAFEMIAYDAKREVVIVSGVNRKPDLSEMNFKSYGNVANGQAFVQLIPFSQFGGDKNYFTGTIWEFENYVTAKSVQVSQDTGDVAILLYSTVGGYQAAVALLYRSASGSGQSLYNIKYIQNYPDHGEGTDIAMSLDGEWVVITGHGGSNGEIAGRLTKVQLSDGAREWTNDFTVGANPKLVYQECWGISTVSDGFVVSCGAGIEEGKCSTVSGQDQIDCIKGRGDKREGALLRQEGNWQSFVFKTDIQGNLLWSRVDSYRCDSSECVSMDDPSFDATQTGSSAAEWITKGRTDDELIVITDEGFGVGVLQLGGSGSDKVIDETSGIRPLTNVWNLGFFIVGITTALGIT